MGNCLTTEQLNNNAVAVNSYQPPTLDEASGKICVIGATGQQGGAVVRALLAQQKFSVRALTRNTTSRKAQALTAQGVEVYKADLNDAESLNEAFKGCYGVFAVTNYWVDMNAETEKRQARNIIKACKLNRVQHVLWSSLEDTSSVMKGQPKENGYYVAHFDVKEEIDELFRRSGIPTTIVVTTAFMENFMEVMAPTDYGQGHVVGFNLGNSKLSLMSLDDFGRVAALVFSRPEYKGRRFGFASDEVTGQEIAAILSKHKKRTIKYYDMDDKAMIKAAGFEMAQMFVYYREGVKSIQKLKSLKESAKLTKLTSFDNWVAANKDKIKLKPEDDQKDEEPTGTVAVIGATGQQGGAVVRALLNQKKFTIRALTRNVNSKKAKALKALGVEVYKADLNDVDSLNVALEGVYGVFAVTNYWVDMKAETEKQQARNIISASKRNNVQHVLWSTLEDTSSVMKGQPKENGYYVAHFDVKEEIDQLFRESGLPTTYVVTTFFMENWITAMPPTDYGQGHVIGMNMSNAKLSMMSLDDFGRVAALVFSKPEYKGKRFGFTSDELNGNEIAAILSKYKKTPINYYEMDDESMIKAAGFEMGQMFVYYREGVKNIQKLKSLKESAKLTKLTSFENWVRANRDKIVLKPEAKKKTSIDEPSGTIAVLGATGQQGGAVVRAILAMKQFQVDYETSEVSKKFKVRAITRNTKSRKASALRALGVEVVKADLEDTDSLSKAFEGVYGVFAVTNFWADMNPETEKRQARNIAKAAKANDVQHLLWSTLEDTSAVMKGEKKFGNYYVPHFDDKAEIDEIFRQSGVPTTYVVTSFFMENWLGAGNPFPLMKSGKGYTFSANMGNKKLSMMNVGDYGRVVARVFNDPETKGQRFGFTSDELTGYEMAQVLSKHLNVDVRYKAVTDAAFLAAVGSEEVVQTIKYFRLGEKQVHKLRANSAAHGKQTSFDEFVAAHKDVIPLSDDKDDHKVNEPSGTIVVIGATGKQGGHVVQALLAQKKFSVRAITRNTKSKKAKALAAQGVQVVKAELENTDSLVKAFKGAYGVFAVTNFWADMQPETEKRQARHIAKAAKLNNVQHILWSTLEDSSPIMKGEKKLVGGYYVPHFDVKEEIDEIFRQSGVPTTYVITSFFMENWLTGFLPIKKTGRKKAHAFSVNMGNKKLSMMSLEDFGRVAALVFSRPEYKGQKFGFTSDELTGDEIAAVLSKHLKIDINYSAIKDETMLAASGSDEIVQMFKYYRVGESHFHDLRADSASFTKLTTFDSWVAANKARIPYGSH